MGRIPDDLRAIIADNIRKCRLKKFPGRGGGKKCAEAFGVSPQQWSPWERGMRTPDEDRMKQIAKFFDVTVADLRQDRRIPSGDSPSFRQSPFPPENGQSRIPFPNAGLFIPPYGTPPSQSDTPHDGSPLRPDELPQAGTPRLTGQEPQSGTDTYWLLANFFSNVSNNGVIVRLTPQDMDYLGDCIALALIRRGVVFPPRR